MLVARSGGVQTCSHGGSNARCCRRSGLRAEGSRYHWLVPESSNTTAVQIDPRIPNLDRLTRSLRTLDDAGPPETAPPMVGGCCPTWPVGRDGRLAGPFSRRHGVPTPGGAPAESARCCPSWDSSKTRLDKSDPTLWIERRESGDDFLRNAHYISPAATLFAPFFVMTT